MLFSLFTNKNYNKISQEKAKEIIDKKEYDYIIDVREQYEYKDGHIENAILLPLGDIEKKIQNIVKDKNAVILVYCRSGNRSKMAANILAKLGYVNINEFGGIITWKYGIKK